MPIKLIHSIRLNNTNVCCCNDSSRTLRILNQSASIFALILAALILKEAFTKRKFVAVALALAGIVLVFWNA